MTNVADLPSFSVDMFCTDVFCIYAVGPKGCGKTTALKRLQAAAWSAWRPADIVVAEFQTFISIPSTKRQYFLLFRDATRFECSRARIPEAVCDLVQCLLPYQFVLYDADADACYNLELGF